MRCRTRVVVTPLFGLVLACSAPKQLREEPAPVQVPPASRLPSATPTAPSAPGAPDPRLPIVGDPLGLLSKTPPPAPATKPAKARVAAFDPGALMASAALEPPTRVEIERDPRAVARGQPEPEGNRRGAAAHPATVQAKRAAEVLGGVRAGGARPHVLYLYASYCKACRNVLPSFLDLVRSYRQRGVQFTAASVDQDTERFSSYAPALGGVLPALWITPEGPGSTLRELRRAGLNLPGDSYSIPLFAVFDRGHRLVSQGHSRELYRLPATLDSLLVEARE